MTQDEQRTRLGALGEKLIREMARKQGHEVIEPLDEYDSTKDMIINGKTVEVKTQQAWHMLENGSFTIKENQINKCVNVDSLYFVETPAPEDDSINIWYSESRTEADFKVSYTRDGRLMRYMPKHSLKKVKTISMNNEPALFGQMKTLSLSGWTGRNRR